MTRKNERHERVSCVSWPFACFVIQALVYELYGFTEEEIAIVEGLDH
jgi:hypothetical protein